MCLEYLTDLVLDGDGFTCLTISKLLNNNFFFNKCTSYCCTQLIVSCLASFRLLLFICMLVNKLKESIETPLCHLLSPFG